jgi:HNH endonuclease
MGRLYRSTNYYHKTQRLRSICFPLSFKTSFATSFATFFTMLLAAIYSTPAVPNQNSVSIGFILCWICLVLIILKSYTRFFDGYLKFLDIKELITKVGCEHIVIAEQKRGKLILDNEQVHHIDGDKENNNPSNLLAQMAINIVIYC